MFRHQAFAGRIGGQEPPSPGWTKSNPTYTDWLIFDDDGNGHLDVRATFETHDGAYIYIQCFGRFIMTPAFQAALAEEGETDCGEVHLFSNPRILTGDEHCKLVNNVVAIAEGRLRQGRVEHQVYQAMNDCRAAVPGHCEPGDDGRHEHRVRTHPGPELGGLAARVQVD